MVSFQRRIHERCAQVCEDQRLAVDAVCTVLTVPREATRHKGRRVRVLFVRKEERLALQPHIRAPRLNCDEDLYFCWTLTVVFCVADEKLSFAVSNFWEKLLQTRVWKFCSTLFQNKNKFAKVEMRLPKHGH